MNEGVRKMVSKMKITAALIFLGTNKENIKAITQLLKK